jgi:hypothetical protein
MRMSGNRGGWQYDAVSRIGEKHHERNKGENRNAARREPAEKLL